MKLSARIFFVVSMFFALPVGAYAASLSVNPSVVSAQVGGKVTVQVYVSSPSTAINAISGVITVPPFMTIESVSRSGSLLNFWVTEPTFTNSSKTISFEGVALAGFQGVSGSVLSVTLRAGGVGVGRISFQSGQVLANDGAGTDVTQDLLGASVEVTPRLSPAPEAPQPVVEEPKVEEESGVLPPEIKTEEEDGILRISGASAYPFAEAVITFTDMNGGKVFMTTDVSADGSFTLAIPDALRSGTYRVTGAVVLPDGTYSGDSEPISVVVGGIEGIQLTYGVLIFLILLMAGLVALGLGLWWRVSHASGRRGAFSRTVLGEVRQAEEVVHKSFKLLRDDVRKTIKESKGSARKASLVEIEDSLEEAEDIIRKEIDDIRDALHDEKK